MANKNYIEEMTLIVLDMLTKDDPRGFDPKDCLLRQLLLTKTTEDLRYDGGFKFYGETIVSVPNGEGVRKNENNEVVYKGQFLKGKEHGQGISKINGSITYTGEHTYGCKNGIGSTEIISNNSVMIGYVAQVASKARTMLIDGAFIKKHRLRLYFIEMPEDVTAYAFDFKCKHRFVLQPSRKGHRNGETYEYKNITLINREDGSSEVCDCCVQCRSGTPHQHHHRGNPTPKRVLYKENIAELTSAKFE